MLLPTVRYGQPSATLENEGTYRNPTCIKRIEDSFGDLVLENGNNDKKTKQIYEAAGKAMPYPHTDWLQSVSRPVSYRDLKPGDLVFYLKYDTSGPIDHVGVYIGNNLMINASGHYGKTYPEGGITIKRIVYGNRRPALYKRLYGID